MKDRLADSGAEQHALMILNAIGDAVLSADSNGSVTYMNEMAERLTGWSRAEASGRALEQVLHLVDAGSRQGVPNPMRAAMLADRALGLTANCVLLRRDGSELAIEDSAAPIHDCDGRIRGAVMVFRDVGAARAEAARMSHLARHDFLTDLPNRVLFGDRLAAALALGRRHGRCGAVMFLDIDGFKAINDGLGHALGDELLQSVAGRLLTCVRQSDTVCRQGGDEFLILLPEIERASDAAISAETILLALATPHRLHGTQLTMSASIGISIYPDDGNEAAALIHCADTAMYDAKQRGGNDYRYFAAAMNAPDGALPTIQRVRTARR